MDLIREVQDLRNRILVLEELSLRKDSITHKTLLQASVTDTSVDDVMVLAGAGNLMAGNGTAEMLFGCTSADVHGQHVCMLFPANDQENLWKIHRKGLPSELGKRRGELPQKEGQVLPRYSVHVSHLQQDAGGEHRGMYGC
ncbi:MAG: hypothetical protein A4E61_00205 [Syntrophorhabdus sp. PtaB.Bin184]|nr:MAG: hypothetical protein A4E61_00205 [Syntrophorhabdus sp. PtaB.Bin184]